MGKIWFCADNHFGQERTLEKSKRPFDSVQEMDFVMLSNWNRVVKPGDTVYMLGDVGIMKILPLLNGDKILIKGNYERRVESLLKGFEHNFKEIYEEKHTITVNKDEKEYVINLVHEPKRVRDIPIDETHINLYGHVHKLCMIKSYGICVSVDAHHFTPIDLDTVLFYQHALLNYYDEDVFY